MKKAEVFMIQDFKFALRQLLKSPGFTAVAVLTLALAIGVNSAIFALINSVVLHPMVPLRPQEVVNVFNCRQNANHDYRQFSYNEFRELRENGGDLFVDLAALEFAVAGIGRDHEMRRSFAFLTSENYFSLMGVKPFRGRFYSAEEAGLNANVPVVVASYGFWNRQGGRRDFVGSTLQINGQPYTVIGITPKGFSGASALIAPDIWVPLGIRSQLGSAFGDSETMHDLANPKNYALNLVGRMRSGLTIDTAKSRLPVLSQRFNAMQADAEFVREVQIQKPSRFSLSTSPEDDGPVTLIGTLLMAMAGAVLLIACLNLANMLLARGTTRAKEIALRLALGASRWRIVRQLLCEGLLLAVCGGVVGLILSVWCNNLLLHSLATLLNNVNFSFIVDLAPDASVLAVTFLFCLLATLFFSLGPALKATKADLVNDLKQQVGEPARIGRFSRFFAPRHISVMAQIALSLMLLFAAGLFFRGALKAAGLNPGFIAAGDLITEMDFTLIKKEPADARREIFNIAQRARELPGVTAVGVATMLPYNNFTNTRRIMSTRATFSNDPKAADPGATALYTASTPGYFDAIGVKILRGRDFTQAECENKDGRRVAIIDEEMAKKLFPNEDAIGQHVRYTVPPKDGSPNDMEVIGVVGTHRHDVQNDTTLARLFVPFAQGYNGDVVLHVRLNTRDRQAVVAMIPTMRSTLREIDPYLPILGIAPWVDLMERSVGLWIVKLGATLFGAFGVIALLLAVVGVYGVKAYAVACRTREIGIRMALGAHRKDVFALIMRQGAMQTALAVLVGLLLSLAAGRVLAQILYQVSPSDPFALITSSLLLTAAALLACFLPARRATYVNPITALRTE
ncbi:MAG TPA: ABC transporter permease [Chthoniobacterales bacterium]|nr:ABC transporter permease [Chthoniobacterales bacterium]